MTKWTATISLGIVLAGKAAFGQDIATTKVPENWLNSVWVIRAKNPVEKGSSLGTGFLISDTGLLVTNYHVISESPIVYAIPRNAKTRYSIKYVLAYDPDRDIAILVLPIHKGQYPYFNLANDDQITANSKIAVIGHPEGSIYNSYFGNIKGITFEGSGRKIIQINIRLKPGCSGGPVILSDVGAVAGISTYNVSIPALRVNNKGNNEWIISEDRLHVIDCAVHVDEVRRLLKLSLDGKLKKCKLADVALWERRNKEYRQLIAVLPALSDVLWQLAVLLTEPRIVKRYDSIKVNDGVAYNWKNHQFEKRRKRIVIERIQFENFKSYRSLVDAAVLLQQKVGRIHFVDPHIRAVFRTYYKILGMLVEDSKGILHYAVNRDPEMFQASILTARKDAVVALSRFERLVSQVESLRRYYLVRSWETSYVSGILTSVRNQVSQRTDLQELYGRGGNY